MSTKFRSFHKHCQFKKSTTKRTQAQTASTEWEIDAPNLTFTHAIISQQKDSHGEALRLYLEFQDVEQTLYDQSIEAIDNTYLDALLNS